MGKPIAKQVVSGACTKCGYTGHLPFQCRNTMPIEIAGSKKHPLEVSSTSSASSDDETPLQKEDKKLKKKSVKKLQKELKKLRKQKSKTKKKKRKHSSSSDSDSDRPTHKKVKSKKEKTKSRKRKRSSSSSSSPDWNSTFSYKLLFIWIRTRLVYYKMEWKASVLIRSKKDNTKG